MHGQKVFFQCPACSHCFKREVIRLKGLTSCPKCHLRFDRKEGKAPDDLTAQMKIAEQERRATTRIRARSAAIPWREAGRPKGVNVSAMRTFGR
jgi:uncharacterized Zn finger protein